MRINLVLLVLSSPDLLFRVASIEITLVSS